MHGGVHYGQPEVREILAKRMTLRRRACDLSDSGLLGDQLLHCGGGQHWLSLSAALWNQKGKRTHWQTSKYSIEVVVVVVVGVDCTKHRSSGGRSRSRNRSRNSSSSSSSSSSRSSSSSSSNSSGSGSRIVLVVVVVVVVAVVVEVTTTEQAPGCSHTDTPAASPPMFANKETTNTTKRAPGPNQKQQAKNSSNLNPNGKNRTETANAQFL